MTQYSLTLHFQSASRTTEQPTRSQFQRWARKALLNSCDITLRLVDRREGTKLNTLYRHKNYPTNVLTFELGKSHDGKIIGDIVICCPVVKEEAKQQKKKLHDHYAHLLVHGVLHLQGFDHQNNKQAKEMETLEINILNSLHIPDPYQTEHE
ncbi:MAG: rRNA maturation RNase YbeY [Betaproteobacteria bacterium]|nr:rRNA maturation RNase YbeY [Betaproteobacteria bacterium]MDE2056338.1 rRNA maturation RNase YbeY [Betaproteobacteria bacterium]